MVDSSLTIEEQARQAFDLRNQFRLQARELMLNQKLRAYLDKTKPMCEWEELIKDKMRRKKMTREEAVKDIYETSVKSNRNVNQKFGLE